jgi:RyR domain
MTSPTGALSASRDRPPAALASGKPNPGSERLRHMNQQHSIEEIARVCHEANRAWCFVNGDVSQVEWAEAPAWQRESAIRGVEFALANPDAPDSAQHDAWSADKVRDGWQYGPVKDAQAKTHPCLVPFDQLPTHQQAKARLFHAIVRALANRFG